MSFSGKPSAQVNDDTELGDHYEYNLYQLRLENDRNRLPITQHRNSILYALESHNVVILISPTGSGKTTQLPQFLDAAGWAAEGRRIAVTQPRRIAASSVASRVAQEMGCDLGQEVGYSVRFDDTTSSRTRIQFITDGLLIRELYRDPLLSQYSVIVVDEAHERTASTDLLLAVLKKIQLKRPELRIIISSATVDVVPFKQFFSVPIDPSLKKRKRFDMRPEDKSPHQVISLHLNGRQFPVDTLYLDKACEDYVSKSINLVQDIHRYEPEGDILIFLTGREEVDHVTSMLYSWSESQKSKTLEVYPLYAGLGPEELNPIFSDTESFQPNGSINKKPRKVIVATNIAETSLTIPGISYVIDCGYVKLKIFNPIAGWDRLGVIPVSQASANQRAGRAGRTKPGKVFRLYTEATFNALSPHTPPEIQRSDLTSIVLLLKALGISNLARFDFLSSPPSILMQKALEFLHSLKVVDIKGQLTVPLGIQLAELPAHPSLGKMLFESIRFKCTQEILTIGAMISIKSVFVRPRDSDQLASYESALRKYAVEEGDLLTYINVYNAFVQSPQTAKWCQRRFINFSEMQRAVSTRRQLQRYFQRLNPNASNNVSCGQDTVSLRKCILSAYFHQVASLDLISGSLKQLRGKETLYFHPDSVLFNRAPKMVLYTEVLHTTKPFARHLASIEPEWLTEIVPDFYQARIAPPSASALSMDVGLSRNLY